MREASILLRTLGLVESGLVLFIALPCPIPWLLRGEGSEQMPSPALTPDVFGLINCAGKTNLLFQGTELLAKVNRSSSKQQTFPSHSATVQSRSLGRGEPCRS